MYPPVIAASHLMADAGWQVSVLSAPSRDSELRMPAHPNIIVRSIAARPDYIVRKKDYLDYLVYAAASAVRLRPDVIYASDPLAAAPGLLAARLAGAKLVYHEHDTPGTRGLRTWLARTRAAAARTADIVVFPNEARAELVRRQIGFPVERLRIVWNMPRQAEIPRRSERSGPLRVYFHGSITPDRLPRAVAEAVLSFEGAVHLRIAGYEAPSTRGYLQSLIDAGGLGRGRAIISHLGQISRTDLLKTAAHNHVGLAFMPLTTSDTNMAHMTGASNKAFDYMAAGLSLLVSDRADWRQMYVDQGFGLACDPANVISVSGALQWLLEHPDARREMGRRARRKIETHWNYDSAFAPILSELSGE